jgi:hypothetical protein
MLKSWDVLLKTILKLKGLTVVKPVRDVARYQI